MAGIILATVGVTGWVFATVHKSIAAAPGVVAAHAGMPWDALGQTVGGLCSLAGVVVYAYVAARGRLSRGENERRLEAGLVDIKLYLARQMAEHQAAMMGRLDAQDRALDAITRESARP